MSSAATITIDEDDEPVGLEDWLKLCRRVGLVYRENVSTQNVFYMGDVEVAFGDRGTVQRSASGHPDWSTAKPPSEARRIRVGTYWMGESIPQVSALAVMIARKFGGRLEANPEIWADIFRGVRDALMLDDVEDAV